MDFDDSDEDHDQAEDAARKLMASLRSKEEDDEFEKQFKQFMAVSY
jgi:hypothetical protein